MSYISNIPKFLFRNTEEKMRKAVQIQYTDEVDKFSEHFQKAVDLLSEWAPRFAWRSGYKIKDIKTVMQEFDFGTVQGIGAFLECEKLNDVRGWLLAIMEEAQELKEQNDGLKIGNEDYHQEVLQLKQAYRALDRVGFYRMYPDDLNRDIQELDELRETMEAEREAEDDEPTQDV